MSRWNPARWFEIGQWVRNDVAKYRSKPGLVAAAERAELAADLLDAVVAVHLGCEISVCPTRQAIQRVMEADKLLRQIVSGYEDVEADRVVIEMVASYGMAVGADVFETCVWIGRFHEAVRGNWYPYTPPELIKRHPVKLHHCRSARAKDSNIIQALVDRFAPGEPNHGKGTKADPGWFYGFRADIWQAYALAVYAADTLHGASA